jgi:hypothetical protein
MYLLSIIMAKVMSGLGSQTSESNTYMIGRTLTVIDPCHVRWEAYAPRRCQA